LGTTSKRQPEAMRLTCTVLLFVHFIFHVRLRLRLCLSGYSLKLCSIGLPSHHDRQLHSTTMHSENKRDPPWESVPSPSSVSSTRMSYLTLLCDFKYIKLCSIGLLDLHDRRLHSAICNLGNERDSFWESVPSPILCNYS
jgi:hypothetical protein